MAYQRRKRRFDRKKVVLVERTICILILLALLALAGRWIAGQLSKEDSQKKKQTKTQTDNTAQKEDQTEAENTQTPVYDFVCSDTSSSNRINTSDKTVSSLSKSSSSASLPLKSCIYIMKFSQVDERAFYIMITSLFCACSCNHY